MKTNVGATILGAVTLGVSVVGLAFGCSGTRATQKFGSSVSAITSSTIVVADGGATIPSNASSAIGQATYEDTVKLDELSVFQGQFGSATNNGYTQR
jgi:hypothetical protein